jgi:peptide/nickel transport system substrate-binding protein
MPPKYYKTAGTAGFRAAPIGTGPYMVDSIVAGQSIHITTNPGYWGAKPKTSSILFTYAPDPSQRLALVQSGAADIAMDLPPAQADQARASKLKVKAVSSTSKPVLFMRTDKAPTNDLRVRQAVAYAIDRNAIVSGIFKNRFKADGYLLNIIPGLKQSGTINHDAAKAKALVASLASKPSITLNYNTDRSPGGSEVAQAIGQMLTDAGFDVKLDPTTYVASVTKILTGQAPQLFITPAVPNVPDPNFFVQGFMTKASITKNCIDSRFDALGAKALEQANTQAASAIYDQLNTLGVARLACFVPLYFETKQFAMRNNVNGFYADPINVVYWQNVTA